MTPRPPLAPSPPSDLAANQPRPTGDALGLAREYPRIADMLGRLRGTDRAGAPDSPVERTLAAAVVADVVAPDLGRPLAAATPEAFIATTREAQAARIVTGEVPAAAPLPPAPVIAPSVELPLPMEQVLAAAPAPATLPATPASAADADDDLSVLLDELTLRDVAREALRARLLAFGEGRHHRSAYELVFVMLAFAVMVLITAPPLVDVLLALHGTKP